MKYNISYKCINIDNNVLGDGFCLPQVGKDWIPYENLLVDWLDTEEGNEFMGQITSVVLSTADPSAAYWAYPKLAGRAHYSPWMICSFLLRC